jgi:hypothetical protein
MKEVNLAKVAITKRADESVDGALQRINEGFEGGRVSKTDLMSWAILRVVSDLDQTDIDEIRREHFNQAAYLDALVKRLKTTGRKELSDEERYQLRDLVVPGQHREKTKRRPRNASDVPADQEHSG